MVELRSGMVGIDDPARCEVCGERPDLYLANLDDKRLRFGCAPHHGVIVLDEIRRAVALTPQPGRATNAHA